MNTELKGKDPSSFYFSDYFAIFGKKILHIISQYTEKNEQNSYDIELHMQNIKRKENLLYTNLK